MSVEKLSFETFGFSLEKEDFIERLQNHPQAERIRDVTIRLHLIDLIRYRLQFRHSFFLSFTARYLLDIHIQALQIYLLCTCIDGLTEILDFLDFPSWLSSSKFNPDEETILNEILQEFLNTPNASVLPKTAYQIYQQMYAPKFGNRKNFLRFFLELPNTLQEILANIYFVTKPVKLSKHKGINEQFSNWTSMKLDQKIKKIADYFYIFRRNNFTHSISARNPINFTIPEFDNIKSNSDNWVAEGIFPTDKEKFVLVHFKAINGESEYHVLRLIIIVNVLYKLGVIITPEEVDNFRNYQLLKENIYNSIRELEENLRICYYYNQEAEIVYILPQPNDQPDLPGFNLLKLNSLFETLKVIPSLNYKVNNCLPFLKEINDFTGNINLTVGHEAFIQISSENTTEWSHGRAIAFSQIKDLIRSKDVRQKIKDLQDWLNTTVDKIDLYNIIPLTKPIPKCGCLPEIERTPSLFSTSTYRPEICVENNTPSKNSDLLIYGRLINSGRAIPNIPMEITIHFKSQAKTFKVITDKNGIGLYNLHIEDEPDDFEVIVSANFELDNGLFISGQIARFTPKND